MKREFSAGGVVFKRNGENISWLIRYPTINEKNIAYAGWTLPKGWIEKEENIEQAALREVREEAGVEAKVVKKIPTTKIFYTDRETDKKVMKFISYFLMEWISDVPEKMDKETEKVYWGNFEEVYKMLKYPGERKVLKQALEMVEFRNTEE